MMAIVERDLRKFFRSPALMVAAMVFPLVQLIVLGNAFGGKIKDAKIGIVSHDTGPQAIRVMEALRAVQSNARTFQPIVYPDEQVMIAAVRRGDLNAGLVIPPQFSRNVYEQTRPRIGLVLDNTDNFMTSTFVDEMTQLVAALNQPEVQPRVVQQIELEVVELYPYVEYMKYLLPGSITLAMFVSVMIGGGIVYIDDKARGVHEGYLVTPITKLELVAGLNVAGALKAMGAGIVLTILGSLIAGVGSTFQPANFIWLLSAHRRHFIRIHFHDVCDDGPGQRSSDPARRLWHSEHTAVFSQRRYLSDTGFSQVAAMDRLDRSVYLFGSWF